MKFKQLKILLIISALLITLPSCDKRNQRQLSYLETQCADAWGVASNRTELENLIKNYFAEKGAIIINIDLANAPNVLVCEACGCYSGRKIIVSVDKDEVDIMKNHGFTLMDDED